jgi:hypothetical protein
MFGVLSCDFFSIAPYCFVVFVFWVLFAFLVVKRGFHASFSVFLCRFLSGKVAESLVESVAAWQTANNKCLETSMALLFEGRNFKVTSCLDF